MDFNHLWTEVNLKNYKQNTRCLALNTILAGKYLVGPVLGQGGFGITYIGYDLNMETKIAIKEYFPVELVSRDTTTMHGDRVLSLSGEKSVTYQQGLKKYVAEAQNVSQFSEVPGVVSVKDFFYENETAYIVMEYIEGISLKEYLKEKGGRLSEEEALDIMKPVLEALVQVHGAGIIHRDISPDNIMLTFENEDAGGGASDGRENGQPSGNSDPAASSGRRKIKSVKLIDFGAARMTAKNDQKSLTIILKHGYAPEEQYRTHGEQGSWTDVYAVCAVMYRMLTGETPVPAMDRMFKDELKGFEELGVKVSENTKTAILKGLAVKKDDRIQSMQELIAVLYDGAKISAAGGCSKKIGLFAGIGCMVAVVLLAVIMITGRNTKGTVDSENNGLESVMSSQTIASDETASDNLITEKTEDSQEENVQVDSGETELNLDFKEEEIGPQIVWPKAETMIAAGWLHMISLRDDGTVRAAGSNFRGQCEVADWDHVAAVYAGRYFSAGLRTDGTVLVAGNASLKEGVESWENIVSLAVGLSHILGLKEDGSVVSAGSLDNGCCDTGDWADIVYIWADATISVGVTSDGEVKVAGTIDGQEDVVEQIRQWKDIRHMGVREQGDNTYYGIQKDGTVLVAGGKAEDQNQAIAEWSQGAQSPMVSVKAGDGFTVGMRADGTTEVISSRFDEVTKWQDLVAITSTLYDVIGLKKDGTIIVTEPNVTGNSTLDEILALESAKQAVWTDDRLYVLCEDGTLKITGFTEYYRDGVRGESEWSGIAEIEPCNEGVAAITSQGKILREEDQGVTYDYDPKSSLSSQEQSQLAFENKELTPRLAESWKNVIDVSCSTKHMVVLCQDGTVKAAGYPENQMETDYKTGLSFDGACEVDNWKDIKQVIALNGSTVGLKTDGTLITTGEMPEGWKQYTNLASIWGGSNRLAAITEEGRAVAIKYSETYGQGNTAEWTDIVQLAISIQHTVGLRADGTVLAVGSNYCGQCDVDGWTDVVSVAAGESATIGITSDGRVLMAGTLPGDIYVAEDWEALPLDVILEAGKEN